MRHPLDSDAIYQDVFVLLHLVYGAEEYSQLHNTRSGDTVSQIEGAQYWSRVQRQVSELLVSIAIKSRIIFDDEDLQKLSHSTREKSPGYFLTSDDDADESKPFSLREACNKILHAASVEFEQNGSDKGSHWNGIVILSGTKDRKPWRVCLFVNSFASDLASLLSEISKSASA